MTALALEDRPPVLSALTLIEVPRLGDRAADWDALVEAADRPSPFLLSWWLEPHDRDPGAAYLLVVDGDDLIGGLAVVVDRWFGVRRVRFLGTGSLAPDHLDLVAAPERRAEVVAALAHWFHRRRVLVDLQGLSDRPVVAAALPGSPLVTVVSGAPYLPLVGAAVPITPLQRRKELGRLTRRLGRDGVSYRALDNQDAATTEQALADLLRLHMEHWGPGSGLVRSYRRFTRAVRVGTKAGAVRFHEMVVQDQVIAIEVSIDVGGRRHRYQVGRSMAREWNGAGNVLLKHVIQGAQADGCVEFDFLRGREPYKYDWTGRERDVLRVRAASGAVPELVLRVLAVAERGRPAGQALKTKVRERLARRRKRTG